jgi:hypothetical protein
MKQGLLALMLLSTMAAEPPAAGPAPGAAGAAPSAPSTDPLDALVADSPFGATSGGNRSGTPGAAGPLELRSIVFVDGAYQFSIFDQGTGKSEWVKIGETGFPFVARSFNRERDALTVEHQGRTIVLPLQPAKMAAAGNAVPPGPSPLPAPNRNGGTAPAPSNANPGPNGQNGVPNNANAAPPPAAANSNTSSGEAQRLQNLADEIRRRRGTGPQLVLPKRN